MTQGRKRRRSKNHHPITFKTIVCAGPPPCITTIFAVSFFHLLPNNDYVPYEENSARLSVHLTTNRQSDPTKTRSV